MTLLPTPTVWAVGLLGSALVHVVAVVLLALKEPPPPAAENDTLSRTLTLSASEPVRRTAARAASPRSQRQVSPTAAKVVRTKAVAPLQPIRAQKAAPPIAVPARPAQVRPRPAAVSPVKVTAVANVSPKSAGVVTSPPSAGRPIASVEAVTSQPVTASAPRSTSAVRPIRPTTTVRAIRPVEGPRSVVAVRPATVSEANAGAVSSAVGPSEASESALASSPAIVPPRAASARTPTRVAALAVIREPPTSTEPLADSPNPAAGSENKSTGGETPAAAPARTRRGSRLPPIPRRRANVPQQALVGESTNQAPKTPLTPAKERASAEAPGLKVQPELVSERLPEPSPATTERGAILAQHRGRGEVLAPHASRGQLLRPGTSEAAPNSPDELGATAKAVYTAYLDSVRRRIKSRQRYPWRARRQKAEGTATVRLSIGRGGVLARARLEQSSGYRTLDRAAVNLVRTAGPFPPIPPLVTLEKVSISIPISYRLRR